VRRQWPDADPPAAAIAGARLHALEGMVKVEVVHASYDPDSGTYEGEFLWHNSSEADEHIAAYGIGGSPACWMAVGGATGYVSTLFGRLIVFREVQCRCMGDAQCRVIGKSVDLWDDIEEDMRYLNAREFVGSAAYPRPTPHAAELPAVEAPIGEAMVGASSAFNSACHQLNRVARTTATVLFTGESGVGKEKFASMLHKISPRKNQPFVAVNCAAIPDTLIESELFGVERGAYTGASHSRPGRFERAHGGTLFLDEIGTLSFVAQGKLLRALQEGEVERVGGTQSIAVDVRVVAATNETLRQAVREGKFREDLFFRLNVFPIHLPPLRERRDDIPLLMNHFLNFYRRKHGGQTRGFTQAAVRALLNYDFPGNIRELQNLIERAVIMAEADGLIDLHHLFTSGETLNTDIMTLRLQGESGTLNRAESGAAPVDEASHRESVKAPASAPSLAQTERETLARAITASKGNLSAAARMLDTTRAKLAFRAKKHGLI
jgi:transcriptional regulator with GAF, ATPase, and Fis domain